MKCSLLQISLIFLLISSCNSPTKTKEAQENPIPFNVENEAPPTSEGFNGEKEALLLDTPWKNGYQRWKPTDKDYEIVQSVLDNAIASGEFNFLKKPIRKNIENFYDRQYIPYINEKGERIIEINAFCDYYKTNNEDWRNNIVIYLDGGQCFWRIKINIDTQTYFEFMVNGDA